jgi:hypothetical protein
MFILLIALLCDYDCDTTCRARWQRCEKRCVDDHGIGAEQQRCNWRCREDYLSCRKEGP